MRVEKSHSTGISPSVDVRFVFDPPAAPADSQATPRQLHFINFSYLGDERGRRFTDGEAGLTSPVYDGTLKRHFLTSDLPLDARRLTWHARVSLDESWPLDIQAVLWDKTHKP